ncbi:thioredoxin family protein [Cytophaga hutchinsonii]|jgi:peroxiredoxin|uniref:Thiol-disulfide isomerase or thioredoxin n=1 Tax=Cytophaga hutchinsonii (strain ATCC 33406 / DSM 1761 / CIP 103989 / NBRC 15051 / NCIMB 9469 / D465) TaxID=269798 RepID=A0A6N4SS45_CYTH3|nr:thioredoxin family protein [Cytophaga hutchinsonii]ABG59242.1 thiol-disulfide isomerase or thioredoxin [Cytophaga hutchinsonii ATCC 33406]SFX33539.1 AhpC/TSA family protein [Cytophaga hutchinsonii ATCC 33406]
MRKITAIISTALLFVFASFVTDGGYAVGDKARDFKLKNIDDKLFSLADKKDAKGFIVVFTCNHCPYAVKYEDRIVALNNKYAKSGYPVVAINPNDATAYPDDNFENMKKRAKSKSFTFPYLVDDTQEIAKAYGATKTPHVFVLKKENADLVVKYIGAIDDNTDDASAVTTKYVEQAVDALLAGKDVTTTSTKAIGCGIKWKK